MNDTNMVRRSDPKYDDDLVNLRYLKKELFYYPGDTFSITNDFNCFAGFTTGSTTNIRFTIPLPKSLKYINNVTINELKLNVRQDGKYVPSSSHDFLTDSNVSSITTYMNENLLTIRIVGTNAWTNAVNNTPLSVSAIDGMTLTFN